MTRFCPRCGKPTAASSAFCSACGTPLSNAPAESVVPGAPASPPRKKQGFTWVGILLLIVIVIAIISTCSSRQTSTTAPDSNTAPSAASGDSPETKQAEMNDIQVWIRKLNNTTDVGYVVHDASIGGDNDDTLTLTMDTDKISTNQDQDRTLQAFGGIWVATYKKHHGGQMPDSLRVEIDDLAGNLVKSDVWSPK